MVASAAHVLVALCLVLVAQLIATVPHSVCRGCNVSESFACGFRRREGATAQQQTFLPCGCLGRRARRCTRRARRVRCPCRPHSLVIIRVDCLSAHRSPRFWAGALGPLASLRSRPVPTRMPAQAALAPAQAARPRRILRARSAPSGRRTRVCSRQSTNSRRRRRHGSSAKLTQSSSRWAATGGARGPPWSGRTAQRSTGASRCPLTTSWPRPRLPKTAGTRLGSESCLHSSLVSCRSCTVVRPWRSLSAISRSKRRSRPTPSRRRWTSALDH